MPFIVMFHFFTGGVRLNIYTIPLNSSQSHSPTTPLNRQQLGSNSSNSSRYSNRNIKRKYEENEEDVKIEVYCDSKDENEFEEIQIPIPRKEKICD
jgi:hypothetical protein